MREEEEDEMEMGMPSSDSGEAPENQGEIPMSGDEESDDSEEGNGEADGESDEDSSTSAVDQEGGDDDGHETWTEDTQREREEELLEKSPERQYERSGQPQYSCGLSSENMDKILYSYDDAKALRNRWYLRIQMMNMQLTQAPYNHRSL